MESSTYYYKSSVGVIKFVIEDNFVVWLKKTDEEYSFQQLSTLAIKVVTQLDEYFAGTRKEFDLPVRLDGTEFQKNVWIALTKIPYGKTCSYKDIAVAVGNPKASRAVGLANNKNPITIIYPCHRVIGSSGKLVGYAGGLEMKEYLLNFRNAWM